MSLSGTSNKQSKLIQKQEDHGNQRTVISAKECDGPRRKRDGRVIQGRRFEKNKTENVVYG